MNRLLYVIVGKASLCDGCDHVRKFVWSSDGRTIACLWCRIRWSRLVRKVLPDGR